MSRFATRFKHRQHTENITDDDECPIHLFNYPWSHEQCSDSSIDLTTGTVQHICKVCSTWGTCSLYGILNYVLLIHTFMIFL